MKFKVATISVSVALLSACGGGSDLPVVDPPPPPPPPITEPPEINAAMAFPGGLEQAGASAFETFIKNGIYANTGAIGPQPTVDAAPPAAPAAPESSGTARGFSTTNTQEQGVDEADRMEYNGNHLFIANQMTYGEDGPIPANVRIMERSEDFSLAEIQSLELSEEIGNINGLYLYEDSLSVVASVFPVVPLAELAFTTFLAPRASEAKVGLNLYDVSNPSESTLASSIEIDGWLLASRRIGSDLYVVSVYNPTVEGLVQYPESDDEKVENYKTILDVPVSDLMPDITIDGVAQDMNQPQDCFIPEAAEESDGYAQLITVTRIDVNNPQSFESTCLSAVADVSYMSLENLYLAAYRGESTSFHQISVGETLSYQVSGEVSGGLGFNSNPQLRMSEANGFFRVVTTDYRSGEPEHSLSVMQNDGSALRTMAQLPNSDDEAVIGKPGEDIYAVRFVEDKAYIVTFERIDPLYVIDLGDNSAPFIAGELEIPGFSSYLHPMENGYLLGVGQNVETQAIPQPGGTPPPGRVVTTGLKVSLFDVSNPAKPIELANISRDDTYTPVEYDYRALSVLKTDNQYQFAMPTESWVGTEDGVGITIYNPQSKLLLLDVDATPGQGALTVVNEIEAENDPDSYVWGGEDRSVIHGENVYYIHGTQVWHSLWLKDAPVNGPY